MVFRRAQSFGVSGFLCATGKIEEAKVALGLSSQAENAYVTIGIHPQRAREPYSGLEQGVELDSQGKVSALSSYFREFDKLL